MSMMRNVVVAGVLALTLGESEQTSVGRTS